MRIPSSFTWILALFICLFTSSSLAEGVSTSGKKTEVRKGHIICTGYIPKHLPAYYAVLTSRPDRFMDDIEIAHGCLLEVISRVNNPRKYKKFFASYSSHFFYMEFANKPPLYGEYDRIRCSSQLQLNGDYAFYEFFFPWMDSVDMKKFVNPVSLGACVHLLEFVSPVMSGV